MQQHTQLKPGWAIFLYFPNCSTTPTDDWSTHLHPDRLVTQQQTHSWCFGASALTGFPGACRELAGAHAQQSALPIAVSGFWMLCRDPGQVLVIAVSVYSVRFV